MEEVRYAFNDTGCINAATCVSVSNSAMNSLGDSHLALEVLHDVQEAVVDFRVSMKLHLHRVKVCECVGDIQRSFRRHLLGCSCDSRVGLGWLGMFDVQVCRNR